MKNTRPDISIIIPLYNTEEYIERCINSIPICKYKIEIIIIDDSSTDQSLNIIQEKFTNDSRIIISHQKKNIGPGYARNIGLDIASGEYIMFLDSDDWLDTKATYFMINEAMESKAEMIMGNTLFYYNTEKNRKKICHSREIL